MCKCEGDHRTSYEQFMDDAGPLLDGCALGAIIGLVLVELWCLVTWLLP